MKIKLVEDEQKKFKSGSTTYQRSPKYGVGKDMRGQLYFHKNYADRIIPKYIYEQALELLEANYPDFKFNTLMYNPKLPFVVRFDESADFDTAREPSPGNQITVNMTDPENPVVTKYYTPQIFHHRWQWVDDDYEGFNVDASYDWSKQWTQKIHNPSGYKDAWNKLLKDANLPLDEELSTAVIDKIKKSWKRDTAHPALQLQYDQLVPSSGQCAVTALLLNVLFGYDIYDTIVGRTRHFFNRDTDGNVIDLTADQFGNKYIDYQSSRLRNKKELLKQPNVRDRFNILVSNYAKQNLDESAKPKSEYILNGIIDIDGESVNVKNMKTSAVSMKQAISNFKHKLCNGDKVKIKNTNIAPFDVTEKHNDYIMQNAVSDKSKQDLSNDSNYVFVASIGQHELYYSKTDDVYTANGIEFATVNDAYNYFESIEEP